MSNLKVKYFTVTSLVISSVFSAQSAIEVSLNFDSLTQQIDAPDGGSVSTFWREVEQDQIMLLYAYSTVDGFPDDTRPSSFKSLCDVFFSTQGDKGMGLSELWSYPSPLQCRPGALGNTYRECDWNKMDFHMYDHQIPLSSKEYHNFGMSTEFYGHTAALYNAALKRARSENKRMYFWLENILFPKSVRKGGDHSTDIDEDQYEEASLYLVTHAKYMIARYGIPIQAYGMMNEGDLLHRHTFSSEQMLKFLKILREKMNEAGLNGVRLVGPSWYDASRIEQDAKAILANPTLGANVDVVAAHLFGGSRKSVTIPRTRKWITSGNYNFKGATSWYIGSPDNIDDLARFHMDSFRMGYSMHGSWQLHLRAGYKMPTDGAMMDGIRSGKYAPLYGPWTPDKTGYPGQIDEAASISPFVRPGMFLVSGSTGNDQYSVDAFAGRGKPETIVVTSQSQQNFSINLKMAHFEAFDMYQTLPGMSRKLIGGKKPVNGVLEFSAPANSITTFVNKTIPKTKPRVYLVVKSPLTPSSLEAGVFKALQRQGLDVHWVSQDLSDTEKNELNDKRHPVDPMGAALYILGPTIDKLELGYAHRSVMAPVLVLGSNIYPTLGVRFGEHIKAGEPLSMRDSLDPPPQLLVGGKPLACGARSALPLNATEEKTAEVAIKLVMENGAVSQWDPNVSTHVYTGQDREPNRTELNNTLNNTIKKARTVNGRSVRRALRNVDRNAVEKGNP